MRTLRLMLFFLLCFASAPVAQAQSMPSLEEMQRQMSEMQQRLMQELRNSPFGSGTWMGDTTFTFRFDTTFENGSAHFFRFGTPGASDDFFQEFDRMFDDFFQGFGGMPGFDDSPRQPADDGGMRQSEDDLLPEEKLRQQEFDTAQPKKPATTKPATKKQSIRI